MKHNFNNLIFILKLCLKIQQGNQIKNVCNELIENKICKTKNYYDGTNKHSAYQIMYNLFSNFKKFGFKGLLNMQGKTPKNNKSKSLEEKKRVRKQKLKELKDKMSKEQLRELLDLYEEIFESLSELDKKQKAKEIKKIKKCCKSNIPIGIICLLFEISRSTFYKYRNWNNNIKDRRIRENKVYILKKIKEIYIESKMVFGVERIWIILKNREKINISYKTAYKYFKELGLKSIIRNKSKRRVDLKNTNVQVPNLLDLNFKNEISNNVLCTDVTFIKWKNIFIYLSAVIDLRNNKIVGWSISLNNDLELVMNSFKNIDLKQYKFVHSDHGVQYSALGFKKMLQENGIEQSMSRIGNSLDNRPIEYWFSIIKEELLKTLNLNKMSFEQIYDEIRNFIYYYNNIRIQSPLGWNTPNSYIKNLDME